MLHPRRTLNCGGRLLSLASPLVMGIINVTPDSFYGGSRRMDEKAILDTAERMLLEGADILDLGGQSTRPGAGEIDASAERGRVVPAIANIRRHFPEAVISVDTYYAEVAEAAVEAGATIINDISAGRRDPDLYATVARLGVPYVLMHMKGTPATMTSEAVYEDVVEEVFDFLAAELHQLRTLGVKDVIIDPGLGFAKTIDHNFRLLKKLHVFRVMEAPLLVGVSRKSMIWRVIGKTPDDALNGTSALHWQALQQGADILRVHDVAPAREVIQLWEKMNSL